MGPTVGLSLPMGIVGIALAFGVGAIVELTEGTMVGCEPGDVGDSVPFAGGAVSGCAVSFPGGAVVGALLLTPVGAMVGIPVALGL